MGVLCACVCLYVCVCMLNVMYGKFIWPNWINVYFGWIYYITCVIINFACVCVFPITLQGG